jgi:hypothetical protein
MQYGAIPFLTVSLITLVWLGSEATSILYLGGLNFEADYPDCSSHDIPQSPDKCQDSASNWAPTESCSISSNISLTKHSTIWC